MTLKRLCQAVHSVSWRRQPKSLRKPVLSMVDGLKDGMTAMLGLLAEERRVRPPDKAQQRQQKYVQGGPKK